ncbi:MAG: hypothetical protein GTN99_10185 [Candidatus Dadabacteria bacterium]|nr:hypothetical protein [Candidatus Dadabacteria bacterium]
MGRMFSLSFDAVAVTAVQDLFQIDPTGGVIIIHSVKISQELDVGDAQAEHLRIRLRRVTDAVTDDVNAVKLDNASAAEAANLAINETTQLTTGAVNIDIEAWNILQPYLYLPSPEMRPVIAIGETFTVDLADAPADSLTMSGTVVFEQIGD